MSDKAAIDNTRAQKDKLPAVHSVAKVILGNGGYVVLGFVANVISANGLSPAGFGLVAISLATLNVLQEICGNGVDMAMVRLAAPHAKTAPAKAQAYYRAALQYKLLINIIVALMLWLASGSIARLFFEAAEMTSMLRWVSLGLIGAALYNYMLARLQAEERFSLYAMLRIGNNIAKLGILAAAWALNVFTPGSVMAAWILAFFAGYTVALFLGRANTRTAPANEETTPAHPMAEVVHFSKWLVGSSFLFCLYSRTDILILGKFADSALIGQYAAAWNITFIIDLMTHSVIIALLPRATGLRSQAEFIHYMKHTFLICLAIAAMLSPLYFLADFFFEIFFPAYTQSADLLRILLLGAIITLLFHPLYLILYTRNRVSLLTLVNFLLVIFSLLLGIAVIPSHLADGAAWVTVAGRTFASLLIIVFVYRELKATLAGAPVKPVYRDA